MGIDSERETKRCARCAGLLEERLPDDVVLEDDEELELEYQRYVA